MTESHGVLSGGALQKVGGVGFLIAAVLFAIGGLLMPHASGPTSDLKEMLKPLGMYSSRTVLASLLEALGFWFALTGVAAVHASIASGSRLGSGAAWAQLGLYLTIGGTTLWTVALALDVGVAAAAANWIAAPPDNADAAWGVVAALSAFGKGVVPLTWLFYWLGLAVLSTAMVLSGIFPRWLGLAGLVISVPTVALGAVQAFVPRSITLSLIFAVLMLLTALWMLMLGIWMARRAW